ncbi:hypothetical protein PV327_011364 [Microctonus hyperodae]|uniref:Phosphatidylinositol-specific phospholipase C X domain-containing protein n=1 Tax=Microctonus hyperodae TaxID=165561 RepID=A0AA39EUK6_MICHY|nr:hypothetical protein PV327_011364 [Microctonus hyperodae]
MIKFLPLILLTWSLLCLHNAEGERDCQDISDDFFAAQIILSFASWENNEGKQHIAIYYFNPGFKYGDKIGFHVDDTTRVQPFSKYYYPSTMNGFIYFTDIDTSLLIYESQSIYQQQCLDGSIFNQLIMGARYFDLRPGKHNGKYWIYHGNYQMTPLQQTIDDVKRFMKNTQEIVFLSFKEFIHGFETSRDHREFIKYLNKQFKDHLLPSGQSWDSSFKSIWNIGKRLLISYDNYNYRNSFTMWRPISQKWGNAQSLGNLRNFLIRVETIRQRPRASMAELTMSDNTIISHAIAEVLGIGKWSLRQMASSTGPHVTQWYNEFLYENASIIAVDYLNATGIVEVALEWNDRKFSSCYHSYLQLMKQYNTSEKLYIIGA